MAITHAQGRDDSKPARTGKPRRGLNGPLLIFVLLAPSLLLLLAVIYYPLLNTFLLSLQSLNMSLPLLNHWVGLRNYQQVLTNPAFDFWGSAGFSLLFSVCVNVFAFIIGFIFALVLNQRLRFQTLWRGLALIPWVIPYVVVAYLFFYMFNSQFGIIDAILTNINIFGWHPFPQPLAWYGGDGHLAVVAVIVSTIWNRFPFFTLMLLAGLQTVPQELLDAATVDGANAWRRFWHVTVPHLRGIILIVTTLQFIWTLNEFTMIWTQTYGGPGTATTNVIVNTYITVFREHLFSSGATIGIIWLVILLVFTYFYIRIMEGRASGK